MNGKKAVLLVVMFFLASQAVAAINVNSPRRFGIGVDGGVQKLIADISIKDTPIAPTFGIYGIFHFSPKFALQLRTGYSELRAQPWGYLSTTKMIPLELSGQYKIAESGKFTPFVRFGASVFSFQLNDWDRFFDGSVFGGLGTNITLTPKYSLLLTAGYNLTTGDDFDLRKGDFPDSYISARAGITYYLQKKAVLERKPYELTPGEVIAAREETPFTTDTAEEDVYLKVIELKSNVDQLDETLSKRNTELKELQVMIKVKDDKIASLERQIAQLRSTTPTAFRSSRVGSRGKRTVGYSEFKNMYKDALNRFYARSYAGAIEDFSALLAANPSHSLAGNCQYWIGESYFGMRKYEKAVSAFEKVLSSFARTPKKDDALIMLGTSYLRLGEKMRAQEVLQDLLSKYPNSEYASKARRLLRKAQSGTIS